MISNKLSSGKVIMSIIVLAAIVLGTELYLASLKNTDIIPRTQTDQPFNNVASVSEESESLIAENAKTESEEQLPIKNVTPTTKPSQTELDKINISDWKTYINKDYGYEIKYPSDWSVVTREDYQVHFLAPETEKFDPTVPGEGNIWIEMQKTGHSLAPDQYFSKTPIMIGGNNGNLFTGVNGGQDPQHPNISYTTVDLTKDATELRINFPDYLEEKDEAKYIGVYYKMIDTFRFIE